MRTMTAEHLEAMTVKDLAQMAKSKSVPGWHAMRKAELVDALAALEKKAARAASRKQPKNPEPPAKSSPVASAKQADKTPHKAKAAPSARRSSSKSAAAPARSTASSGAIDRVKDQSDRSKNLAYRQSGQPAGGKDRLVVMVRDPFWLHAYWELSRSSVQRAEVALAHDWHTAKPILRLFEIADSGSQSAAETLLREITVHGGTNNWYLDVAEPPKSYRVDIGYKTASGKFHVLARSNMVTTPRAGAADVHDDNWADVAENAERIYALSGGYTPEAGHSDLRELFEERFRRSMASPLPRSLVLAPPGGKKPEFRFHIDAEMVIHGSTEPDARVTLQGDPVQLRPDGTFTVRFGLPDCRQIIPAVASSPDGTEQRTIVVAVERNTKVMEPVTRDLDD